MGLQKINVHVTVAKVKFENGSQKLSKGTDSGWASRAALSRFVATLADLRPQVQHVANEAETWGKNQQDACTFVAAGHTALESALGESMSGESTTPSYLEEARNTSAAIHNAENPESDLMEASSKMAEYQQVISELPKKLESLLEDLQRAKALGEEITDIQHGSFLGVDVVLGRLEHWQNINHQTEP